jgi:hypothetical protein
MLTAPQIAQGAPCHPSSVLRPLYVDPDAPVTRVTAQTSARRWWEREDNFIIVNP